MVDRRKAVGVLSGLGLVGAARAAEPEPASPAVLRSPEHKYATGVDVADFADPKSDAPQGERLQAALDTALAAGADVRLPKGTFVVERGLVIRNDSGRDRAMPRIRGAGVGVTVIAALPFDGPVLSVRGVAPGPLASRHFLIGGGLSSLEIRGEGVGRWRPGNVQTGIEVLGWWHGDIEQLQICQLSGHGIRSAGDAAVDSNPDFTASILSLRFLNLARLGGWGFLDDNPIGSPGWSWESCLFQLAGQGGACVRSSAHSFRRCSFSACGWTEVDRPAAGTGVGLQLGAVGRAVNRIHVGDCEFDTQKDAHVVLDGCLSSTVERTRFIHNDRYNSGRLTPPVGVLLASGGAHCRVSDVTFNKIIFRIDTPGEMTGFRWEATANVTGVEIDGVVWSDETQGKVRLTRYDGHDARAAHVTNNYRIHDGRQLVSAGAVAPFLRALLEARAPGDGAVKARWAIDPEIDKLYGGRPPIMVEDGRVRVPVSGWWDVGLRFRDALPAEARASHAHLELVAGRHVVRRSLDAGVLDISERFYLLAGDAIELRTEPASLLGSVVAAGTQLDLRLAT